MQVFTSEADLFAAITRTPGYDRFARGYLRDKVRREAQAWEILLANRGEYSGAVLDSVFTKIEEKGRIWFGLLLLGRNRGLILKTTDARLNQWLEDLLFGEEDVEISFAQACQDKIDGTDTGLPSLLLYLRNPENAKILIPTSQRGLGKVRALPTGDKHTSAYYRDFCNSVNDIQNTYRFWPEEMDWILWVIDKRVNRLGTNFQLDANGLA